MMAKGAPRRIGILGGMGPEATVLLMSHIIARTKARDDSDHVPMIVDNNTQVPSRIKALIEKSGEDPAPVLAAMARRLEAAGAEALAMPCNTAHNYAPAIRAAVSIPFLDMVELTCDRIAVDCTPDGAVGLLASPAVRITGLYERPLARRGLKAVYPDDEAAMLATIRAIKAQGDHPAARTALRSAADGLARTGVGALIIACSEFSIVADAIDAKQPIVDSIDALADAAVAFACGTEVRFAARA
jgi:aspartate racemase